MIRRLDPQTRASENGIDASLYADDHFSVIAQVEFVSTSIREMTPESAIRQYVPLQIFGIDRRFPVGSLCRVVGSVLQLITQADAGALQRVG